VPETVVCLLVGGMPRNAALWVPRPVQWITTSFRSAIVSSIVKFRSGKPLRHVVTQILSSVVKHALRSV
jgi:hypothetical protein